MRKRIAYSQNFLTNRSLISKLITSSSINEHDHVLDIGAGKGIITDELAKVANQVTTFEIDANLYELLLQKYKENSHVKIKSGDFLKHALPEGRYKVFSNIPFNMTSTIVRRLTDSKNPPIDSYLVMQKEAAKKLIGKPLDSLTSQSSTLLFPWFEVSIVHYFNKTDFFPIPNIDIVLVRITKRASPLIVGTHRASFQDFITFAYNQTVSNITEGLTKFISRKGMSNIAAKFKFNPYSKPTELPPAIWVNIFYYVFHHLDAHKKLITKGSYAKQMRLNNDLQKIHRTRLDKNWRNN